MVLGVSEAFEFQRYLWFPWGQTSKREEESVGRGRGRLGGKTDAVCLPWIEVVVLGICEPFGNR